MNTQDRQTCVGGCHCGAVRFEITIPREIEVRRCNCSICAMTGYAHLTVSKSDFRLISGEVDLLEYNFNTRVARHLFCGTCGIKSFYVPRSHPDAWSVNFNCITLPEGTKVNWSQIDGQNWELNEERIRDIEY